MHQRKDVLVKTAEECGELTQAAIKTWQFGLQSCDPTAVPPKTNRRALCEEAGDVMALIDRMVELGYINKDELKLRRKMKLRKARRNYA